MTAELNCRKCGACCSPQVYGSGVEQETGYVQLLGIDLVSLSDEYLRKHVVVSKDDKRLACKENHNGCVCVALRGTVGKRVFCTIYERRPHLCRIYKKGSGNCIEMLLQLGVPRHA